MKKSIVILLMLTVTGILANAQSGPYIIRLKDKKGSPYSLSQPSAFLSAKAIARRAKQNIPLDSTDLPVNPQYLQQISGIPGVIVNNTSKWFNQAMVTVSDPSALSAVMALPFVIGNSAQPVHTVINNSDPLHNKFNETVEPMQNDIAPYRPRAATHGAGTTADVLDYGKSYAQIHIHEGEYLHNLGFQGEGMTIAILDAGFLNYKTNTAFERARNQNQIKGEYDFVNQESSVNEDNTHGANCFSIIGANVPGVLVGSAPNANYYLYRTENVASESIMEEQFWAAGAEKADSVGVDMLTSSLGYINFDDPAMNHSYAQRDGNTALITNAADLAAKKGILVMLSCGNNGASSTQNKFVMCPGDADSVLTVGAIDTAHQIAVFSSWGPNGAGKVKPNIVSVGKATAYIRGTGEIVAGNGTSYSNPNVAGLVVCLWQAFSEFTNMDIIDAVQKSSDRYNLPDERFGYGVPNFKTAYALLQQKREANLQKILKTEWIKAFPVPFKRSFTILLKAPATGKADMELVDAAGHILQRKQVQTQQNNFYYIEFYPPVLASGIYYVRYKDGKNKTTLRLVKE